jgi:SAM-dependent methyltransferase
MADAPSRLNFDFYDANYRSAHPLLFLLHGQLSFDQQAKARRNLALAQRALHTLRAADKQRARRVLDYGCGFGTLLFALAGSNVDAFAYDLAPRASAQLHTAARMLGRKVTPLQLNAAGELPVAGLDLIVCSHVLEHVDDDDALLARLAGALRSGGFLLANVPINEVWCDPKHVRQYTQRTATELLERHSLRMVCVQEADRWSGWLLRRETNAECGRGKRSLLRALRVLLASLPLAGLERSEDALLSALPPQQLLLLAQKP